MRRFAVLILSVLVTGVSLSLMAADAPLRTIMPYSLLYGGDDGGEKLIERLRAVKARSAVRPLCPVARRAGDGLCEVGRIRAHRCTA